MKKTVIGLTLLGASTLLLGGCSNTEVGTTVGAAGGAGLGYAVSGGSALGTVIGAGAGGLLGYHVGASQDRRHYYRHH